MFFLSQELYELEQLSQQSDDLGELAKEELQICHKAIKKLETSLIHALVPRDEADRHGAVLEVRAG